MTTTLERPTPERGRSTAFPAATMRFLGDLDANNTTPWFHENRARYDSEVVDPLKQSIAALRPMLLELNPDLDVAYKVNTTVLRINRDRRFAPDAPPYRNYVKVSFPILSHKWSTDPVFGFGVFPTYAYVAFRIAGEKRQTFVDRYHDNLRKHGRAVARWLDDFDVSSRLSVLGGEHDAIEPRGPCPANHGGWLDLKDPTIGAYWTKRELETLDRPWIEVMREKMTILYFLKLLAISLDVATDAKAYFQTARSLCASST